MKRYGPVALALVALTLGTAYAAPPARTMYTAALAREEAVRVDLASDAGALATLREARAVVAAYEALVRQYPASGYSDNALWQAGRLSLDAFGRFGQGQDREKGVRLLRTLASEYPASKLARQVTDTLAKFDGGAPSLATIRDIRRTVLPDAVRITVELDAEVAFHDERIGNPERVFVDLSSTRASAALLDRTLRFDSDADVVRQVRIGRHPNNTTRVVLDTSGISTYSVYPLYAPYRLVIDCIRAKTMPANAVAQTAIPARRLGDDWGRSLPAISPAASTAMSEAIAEPTVPARGVERPSAPPAPVLAAVIPPSSPAPPTVNPPVKPLSGGFSIARQLGLNVSRIVIDPGHGGHDPGAKGKSVTEAELVLDVALRLEKLLTAVPGVEVILTRRTDEFIGLQERTAIANREGADLFLSIHANAGANQAARGVETYFLNFANNLSAARVAARENAASGQAMGALPDFVKAIALNNKLDESRAFATHVQRAMIEKLRSQNKGLRDLGVKQAPFVVLIGAAMPSVLAEVSFVTNAQDAKLLRSPSYRQKIAESLYGGIRKYQTSLKHATAIAHQ